jgi:hypothetical protein
MCLLLVSTNGARLERFEVETAFQANPHGWGVVMQGGECRKGFKLEALHRALDAAEGKPYMAHWRYATHGELTVGNCHPFRVADNLWLAHNGIIDGAKCEIQPGMSDSRSLALMMRGLGYLVLWQVELAAWESYIGSSNKVAWFDSETGEARIAHETQGHWVKPGLWASNHGYMGYVSSSDDLEPWPSEFWRARQYASKYMPASSPVSYSWDSYDGEDLETWAAKRAAQDQTASCQSCLLPVPVSELTMLDGESVCRDCREYFGAVC